MLCDSARVDPGRVVLGHSGDTADCDHLAELADAGFMLGMDRFGINLEVTFEARADTLVEMCRRGYAERSARPVGPSITAARLPRSAAPASTSSCRDRPGISTSGCGLRMTVAAMTPPDYLGAERPVPARILCSSAPAGAALRLA